uniref:Uncharacterized protein n=1 Tax=viral metagenome TaxID=1070528 RepID=A0A6C0IH66_9ZZZZ
MSSNLPSVPNTNLKAKIIKAQLNSAPALTHTIIQLCKEQGVVPILPKLSWKDDSDWAIKMNRINEKITELCKIYNEIIDSTSPNKNKLLQKCESTAEDLMNERNTHFRASYLALCEKAKNYIPPSFQKGGTRAKKRHTKKRSKK